MWINALEDILVPIAICVALPVLIVWLVSRRSINADKLRTQVLIEALQHNADLDADKLAEAMRKPQKTPEQIRTFRLAFGLISFFMSLTVFVFGVYMNAKGCNDTYALFLSSAILAPIGLGNLIVYYVTRPKK